MTMHHFSLKLHSHSAKLQRRWQFKGVKCTVERPTIAHQLGACKLQMPMQKFPGFLIFSNFFTITPRKKQSHSTQIRVCAASDRTHFQ